MKFRGEWLRRLVWHESMDESEAKIVHTEICDTTRWSIVHRIVFEFNQKFYESYYSVGATENQDESPYEFEDEVDCPEVEPVEKTVVVYERMT